MSSAKKSGLYYYSQPSESRLLRSFRESANDYPAIKPEGYSRKTSNQPTKRILTSMWSDMHYGTDLKRGEHLKAYSNVEEARRTARVTQNILDFKRDKRAETSLHLDFNGDDFAGLLGHDDRAVAELSYQMFRTAHLEAQVVSRCAAEFPSVTINRGYGNHGRNLLRHLGRADNSKWDNFELISFMLVRGLCRELKNVTWRISRRPALQINVFGWNKLMTHGDTVLGKKPGTGDFERALNGINSSPYYNSGRGFDIVELGHWHQGMQYTVGHTEVFVNPALLPPDGFSESSGYLNNCGQYMYETTESFAVGDTRKVMVGPAEDNDSSLDAVIQPWSENMVFTEEDEEL